MNVCGRTLDTGSRVLVCALPEGHAGVHRTASQQMICCACEWRGSSVQAVEHEHTRHDGAQTCWPAIEAERDA